MASNKSFLFLLSLLRGVSIAVAIYGGFLGFFSYSSHDLLLSLILLFMGASPGLFFVIFFEYINIRIAHMQQNSDELKKIRELLEKQLDDTVPHN